MRVFVAIFSVFMIVSTTALAETKTLSLAATEYPPFYGKDLQDNGFMTEIVRESLLRRGYSTEISFLPWKRALASAKSGKHDALFTIWYRAEREEWFVFSDPLPANELVLLKLKDSAINSSKYSDLTTQKIGVVRGYALPPGFEEAALNTSLANDDEENLRKLLKGRVDLVLTDRILAQHIINTKLSESADQLVTIEPPVHTDIQYLVISKQTPDHQTILDEFNAGLTNITQDGTLKNIMAKHGF